MGNMNVPSAKRRNFLGLGPMSPCTQLGEAEEDILGKESSETTDACGD